MEQNFPGCKQAARLKELDYHVIFDTFDETFGQLCSGPRIFNLYVSCFEFNV